VIPTSDDKASRMLEALVGRASNDPRTLVMLANHLMTNGEGHRAASLALEARSLAADDPEVHLLASELLNLNLAPWHFSIVHDEARNAAFDGALRRIVRPGMRVLDIGSGTGLLAMMAARAGAGKVVSCEVNPSVAQAAHKVVAANGYADRICIIGKHSDVLDLERDVGGPVDVVVSEVINKDLIGEHVLQVMEGAQRFLKAGGSIIPAGGSVRVALANYSGIQRMCMATVQGFDLSPFNQLTPTCLNIKRHDRGITLLSDYADLFAFDFASGGPFPEARSAVSLVAKADGANGVAQWIRLTMDAAGEYENHPATHAVTSNWAVLFYPFIEGLRCRAGETITVCGSHNRDRLRVWAEKPDCHAALKS
jgi:protein arginine N-methyltransferase 7